MEPSSQTITGQSQQATAPDAQKLLESANSASEQVGVLHLGFIAACAYVIVIAIGRTDLDLLIGKGIRLPIIDTEVPIVGFFAFAPWILVIADFSDNDEVTNTRKLRRISRLKNALIFSKVALQ